VSETILKVPIGDLTTLRIACDGCGSAAELSLDGLDHSGKGIACPGCGAVLRDAPARSAGSPDAFDKLAQAVRELKRMRGRTLEFVLPVRSQSNP
jgi:hypothetical protein